MDGQPLFGIARDGAVTASATRSAGGTSCVRACTEFTAGFWHHTFSGCFGRAWLRLVASAAQWFERHRHHLVVTRVCASDQLADFHRPLERLLLPVLR